MDTHSTLLWGLCSQDRLCEWTWTGADLLHHRYYCLSILDKHHHPDITLHQGIKILTMCTDELKRRLPIDFKGMVVKAVKADGIVDIEFDDDKVVKCA